MCSARFIEPITATKYYRSIIVSKRLVQYLLLPSIGISGLVRMLQQPDTVTLFITAFFRYRRLSLGSTARQQHGIIAVMSAVDLTAANHARKHPY